MGASLLGIWNRDEGQELEFCKEMEKLGVSFLQKITAATLRLLAVEGGT